MSAIYQFLFAWLPSGLAIAILGLFALLIVLLVLHLIQIIRKSLFF